MRRLELYPDLPTREGMRSPHKRRGAPARFTTRPERGYGDRLPR